MPSKQRCFLPTPPSPHLSRVVRTDGDAEICVDEGVVDQVSHILEGLPIVFADTVREQQLEPQTTACFAV